MLDATQAGCLSYGKAIYQLTMDSLKLILSNLRYFAPAWVFASLNIAIGTWVLYLPNIKEKLSLTDSELGIALFSLALGTLASLPFVPYLNKKFGTGQCTKIGIILFAIAYITPLLAPTYPLLCACLFLTGIFTGFTDISMNALVSEIEKLEAINFMSAAHGFFSLGGVIGAGVGSFLLLFYTNPAWHMLSVAIFLVATNLFLAKQYTAIKEPEVSEENTTNKLSSFKLLIGLSLIAFIIMCNEGAVEHWSNLYLLEIVQVDSTALAGLGFISFSITMTIGRFLGDQVSARFGALKIILYGCLLAILGYLFILSSQLVLAVLGFAVLGFGLSVIVPELFRLAGKTEGVPSSVGISIVSGVGFLGFLLGPVLLGLISDFAGLKTSYVCLLVLMTVALLLSFLQRRSQ